MLSVYRTIIELEKLPQFRYNFLKLTKNKLKA